MGKSPKAKTCRRASPEVREAEKRNRLLDEAAKRISSPKERRYVRALLEELLGNNTLPEELLQRIPISPETAGKTRFDQLYDAAMFLAFPGYREETLEKLLGPNVKVKIETKIWRAIFPAKFRLSHVLLRAPTFQQAFALGCDYACRMSLRLYRKIPSDLTVRIQFVSEKAVRRMLKLRWANRVKRRKQLQLVGRAYTPKEFMGARLVALGDPRTPEHSIFKYAEARDLRKILNLREKVRVSSVETETFRPDDI
ncbi:hypothetical protein LCGC14_1891410 [marine sediment metagenome]|uniref:Uncharacterized protein n=1 Tax=marine sediment metagenome TaxID=412755 RepID=A0A0F9IXJ5_9ZZZZ